MAGTTTPASPIRRSRPASAALPQNIDYAVSGIHRERANGQLTLQWQPVKSLTSTLDYTYCRTAWTPSATTSRRGSTSARRQAAGINAWPPARPSIPSRSPRPPTSRWARRRSASRRRCARCGNVSPGRPPTSSRWNSTRTRRIDLGLGQPLRHQQRDRHRGVQPRFDRGGSLARLPDREHRRLAAGSDLQQVTGSSFRNSYMKSETNRRS